MAAPTATQDPAQTVHGVKTVLRFTPAGGGSAVELLGMLADYDGQIETIKNLAPGTDKVLRPNRESQKSSEESFLFDVVEIKKGYDLLGGLNKLKKGDAQLWIYDPDDSAGEVKILTNEFAASLKREGNVSFGADDFAKMRLRITNLSGADVTLDFDTNEDPEAP